ncbi:uncharacterized protein LOC117167347 isoform X3 [Belonocnema kinseyi]|uniref:uncharacterized protein LOC117167347 isoform X3 n=1 Tax=Belonocnema kinseyi TaxID=2817044 RepID=UPI00143D947A|nr:uncharacterized protein LOC117167347 isoform X3 [Belonocnema kinseyi]
MSIAISENSDFLKVHVQRFAKQQNLSNTKFEYSTATKDGDNYLGILIRVEIEGMKNGGIEKFNLIFKRAPRDTKLREVFGVRHLYIHEIKFYEEKLPIFVSMLSEHNLSINDIPRYYGGSAVPENEAIESEGPKYIDRLREFKKGIPKLLDFVINGRNAEPYAVLNHGDYWSNNILFSYNDDEQPENLFFLDFQGHRYASPALDISYMLFNCCTPEMRIKHYDELLYQYHNSLAQCLNELGSDVEKLFPFEMLLQQLKHFAIYGGITGMLFLHLFTRQEGESPKLPFDIEYIKTLTKKLRKNCLYASMMRGTFKDMVDKNYIS